MKQRHRVFIAINLPEDIKKKLADFQKKWPELPIRWTKLRNIHITLDFIGYIDNDELLDICKITKEVASRHSSFSVNLTKICYGPPYQNKFGTGQATDKKPPRMIWAVGARSEEFASLKDDLDKTLSTSEKREFSPHITLGRIRKWEWQRIEPEERPAVEEDINLSFSVNSIEVMESELKRGGAEYTVLESAPLG